MSTSDSANKVMWCCLDNDGRSATMVGALLDLNLPVNWDSVSTRDNKSLFVAVSERLSTDIAQTTRLWNQYTTSKNWKPEATQRFLTTHPFPVMWLESSVSLLAAWEQSGVLTPDVDQRLCHDPKVLALVSDRNWWQKLNAFLRQHPTEKTRWGQYQFLGQWQNHHTLNEWLHVSNRNELNKKFAEFKKLVGETNEWTSTDLDRWARQCANYFDKPMVGISNGPWWRWELLFENDVVHKIEDQTWKDVLLSDSAKFQLLHGLIQRLGPLSLDWDSKLPVHLMSNTKCMSVLSELFSKHVQSRTPLNVYDKKLIGLIQKHASHQVAAGDMHALPLLASCEVLLGSAPAKFATETIQALTTAGVHNHPWKSVTVGTDGLAHKAYGKLLGACLAAMDDAQLIEHWSDVVSSMSALSAPARSEAAAVLCHCGWVRLQRTSDPQLRAIATQIMWSGLLAAPSREQKSFFGRFAAVEKKIDDNPRLNPFTAFVRPDLIEPLVKTFQLHSADPQHKMLVERMMLKQFAQTEQGPGRQMSKRKM